MLKSIDILLGLTVVMLVVSMAVTVLTQFVIGVLNTRGRHLARGLADLLQQIDPQLERAIADQIATAVLKHPMINHLSKLPFLGVTLGDTIHREELTRLLMDLATGQGFGLDKKAFPDATRDKLKGLLKNNGIEDPTQTLENVRAYALQLELASPELASNVRHGIALMQEANSRLLAKINSWFDQTIDRVSARFTASTRVVTLICSMVVVGALQLDTLDILNRLSVDDQLRQALVVKAMELDVAATSHEQRPADPKVVQNELQTLNRFGLIDSVGFGGRDWWGQWQNVNPMGIFLSVVLVSLGAPFWYGALQKILKFRSVLAGKDDAQRNERQTLQDKPPQPSATSAPASPDAQASSAPLPGERGILG